MVRRRWALGAFLVVSNTKRLRSEAWPSRNDPRSYRDRKWPLLVGWASWSIGAGRWPGGESVPEMVPICLRVVCDWDRLATSLRNWMGVDMLSGIATKLRRKFTVQVFAWDSTGTLNTELVGTVWVFISQEYFAAVLPWLPVVNSGWQTYILALFLIVHFFAQRSTWKDFATWEDLYPGTPGYLNVRMLKRK